MCNINITFDTKSWKKKTSYNSYGSWMHPWPNVWCRKFVSGFCYDSHPCILFVFGHGINLEHLGSICISCKLKYVWWGSGFLHFSKNK
jgi:hypothetical protein